MIGINRWSRPLGALFVGLLAACGFLVAIVAMGTSRDAEAPKVALGQAAAAPPGVANASVAAVPVSAPAVVAWTGKEILMYGPSDPALKTPNSGAAYDPVTGRWRQLPASPFEHPLMDMDGLWTGSKLIVGGVACDNRASADDDTPECYPGDLQFAAYEPDRDAWARVARPPSPERSPGNDGAWGWAIDRLGESAVLTIGGRDLAYRPDGTWDSLPPVPFPRAIQQCVAGDRLFATWPITGDTSSGAVRTPEGTASTVSTGGLRVAQISEADHTWKELEPLPLAGKIENFLSITCSADTVLLYTHSLDRVWSLDIGAEEWHPEPSPAAELTQRPAFDVPGQAVPEPPGFGSAVPEPPGFGSSAWSGKQFVFWNAPVSLEVPKVLQEEKGAAPFAQRAGNALAFDPITHLWTAVIPGSDGSTIDMPHQVTWIEGVAYIPGLVNGGPGIHTYRPSGG